MYEKRHGEEIKQERNFILWYSSSIKYSYSNLNKSKMEGLIDLVRLEVLWLLHFVLHALAKYVKKFLDERKETS